MIRLNLLHVRVARERKKASATLQLIVLLAALLAGAAGLAALLAVWAATHLLAHWWTRALGGLTGDTYGALCEIAEVVALATLTARPIFGGG